jgi:hypothetical protein
MTKNQPQPDINVVIAELSIQVANLTRENAILKATIQAMQGTTTTDGGELETE